MGNIFGNRIIVGTSRNASCKKAGEAEKENAGGKTEMCPPAIFSSMMTTLGNKQQVTQQWYNDIVTRMNLRLVPAKPTVWLAPY